MERGGSPSLFGFATGSHIIHSIENLKQGKANIDQQIDAIQEVKTKISKLEEEKTREMEWRSQETQTIFHSNQTAKQRSRTTQ